MRSIFLSLAALFVLVSSSLAQETPRGGIRGRVLDKETKQPVIGASVWIPETKHGARTNSDGHFLIKDVPEDVYKLKITSIGYIAFLQPDVRVIRNKTTQLVDIELVETKLQGDSIVVSTGLELEDRIRPVSNYSYSAGEIKRSPGAAGDIFRAIEALPGVSGSGGEFSAFSVRGGSPKENIILVDNIPVDQVSHMEGGNEAEESQGGRFSIFTSGLIEEANFQGGGFGARYGGKNASLIELKIVEGNQENITADGHYDILGWEVNYNGPTHILPTTSALLSVRHNDFKTILKIVDQEDQGWPWFTDIVFKTTTEIDARNKLSLLGIYANEYFERTMEHVLLSKDYAGTDLYRVDRRQVVGGLNWQMLIGDQSFGRVTAYHRNAFWDAVAGDAYVDHRNGVPSIQLPLPKTDSLHGWIDIEKETGLKADMSFGLSDHTLLNVGANAANFDLEITRSQKEDDTIFVFYPNDPRPDPWQKFLIRPKRFGNANFVDQLKTFGTYAELAFDPIEQLTITPGVRWDYNDYNEDHIVSPRFSANYKFSPETSLSLGTGIYYQMPELTTLIYTDANRSVKHEQAIHAILSFKTLVAEGLRLTIEPYYKKLNDLAVRTNRQSFVFENTGDGYATGIDFGLIKRLDEKWYGQLNYSYAISKRRDREGEPYYNSDFNQPHVVNILLGYELDKNWHFSTKWKYAAGRPTDSYIIHKDVLGPGNALRYSQEITENNGDRLPDFHTLNVRIDRRIQIGNLALVAFLDVLNVYGRLNLTEQRFHEINGEVEPRGLRIVPTAGLKLEI